MSVTTNERGIPKVQFINDVALEAANRGGVEELLKQLQELLAKYRYMESSSLKRRQSLREKIPEFERTIAMIRQMQDRQTDEPLDVTFELADTLYAHASIQDCQQVYLWLGANTMLAYTLEEALNLLQDKSKAAQSVLEKVASDLSWLRDQITTTQVNIARVYNWEVRQRRQGSREKDPAVS